MRLREARGVLGLGHVAEEALRRATGLLPETLECLVERILLVTVDDDVRAFLEKEPRRGIADSFGAAGDEDGLVLELQVERLDRRCQGEEGQRGEQHLAVVVHVEPSVLRSADSAAAVSQGDNRKSVRERRALPRPW